MTFDADAVLRGLKGFQRDAVLHVMDRFYGDDRGSGRFLVADETGLGKSIVARGVIAKTIERLQDDDSVERIDIVYICSNSDLANQNLRRLNVTGDRHVAMATRLTLLARERHKLSDHSNASTRKKVNLVSFTPGTSFKDGGWRTGNAEERALLCILLEDLLTPDVAMRDAGRRLFQVTVRKRSRFDAIIDWTREAFDDAAPDPRIADTFTTAIKADGLLDRFVTLREQVAALGDASMPGPLWHDVANLIAAMVHASIAGSPRSPSVATTTGTSACARRSRCIASRSASLGRRT